MSDNTIPEDENSIAIAKMLIGSRHYPLIYQNLENHFLGTPAKDHEILRSDEVMALLAQLDIWKEKWEALPDQKQSTEAEKYAKHYKREFEILYYTFIKNCKMDTADAFVVLLPLLDELLETMNRIEEGTDFRILFNEEELPFFAFCRVQNEKTNIYDPGKLRRTEQLNKILADNFMIWSDQEFACNANIRKDTLNVDPPLSVLFQIFALAMENDEVRYRQEEIIEHVWLYLRKHYSIDSDDPEYSFYVMLNTLGEAHENLKTMTILNKRLEDVQTQIDGSCQTDKYFEKTVYNARISDRLDNTIQAVKQAEGFLDAMAQDELNKILLYSEYVEICKWRDKLNTPGCQLASLMKSTCARKSELLCEKLLGGNYDDVVSRYNELQRNLSENAINPEDFRNRFNILNKPMTMVKAASAFAKKSQLNMNEHENKDGGSRASKVSGQDLKAGMIVQFGSYPQTEDGTVLPIEWLVLAREGQKALLLSKYGLDAKPYNTKKTYITWEKCTLRTWLNGGFISKAFSASEQAAILTTSVDNGSGQGYLIGNTGGVNNTQDKLFLLSYAEANKYLDVTYGNNNLKSRVAPTAYTIAQGASTYYKEKTEDGNVAGWWWLRSPGLLQYSAAGVDFDGSLMNFYVDFNFCCVRPAFWLNLESEIF